MDSTSLFSSTPSNCIGVFDVAFAILRSHWRSIGKIAIFQFFSILATIIVFLLVTFAFTATYIAAIQNHIKNAMDGGYGARRALFDSSVGLSGASRYLSSSRHLDDLFGDMPQMPVDGNLILILMALYALWVVGLSLVSSVFVGAYNHALANIYGGIVPNVNRALRQGLDRMFAVFIYHIYFILVVTAILFLTAGIPILKGMPHFENMGSITFGLLIGFILVGSFASFMSNATPSIIVEKKSAGQAFIRSWKLCQSYIGFVLCTRFMFHGFVVVLSIIVNSIFDFMPGFLSFFGHAFVNAAAHALEPVFAFVLYISLRVHKEQITSEDIANEIGNGEEVLNADAVEMSDNTFTYRDNKGSYANVFTSDERQEYV